MGLGLFGGRLSTESLRSLYICIAYGASSILISLIYKALLRFVCAFFEVFAIFEVALSITLKRLVRFLTNSLHLGI